ncbi:type II secretion system GspH family protein [Luminiphilus sp.]|jgi:prepilin-type N-terminal cleavage/methylation domain-containing protein|nr:type II secretion system GspH family protein [Luminiphilus sp.]
MKVLGFSLIELLVVLAIASTLVALVGPASYRSIERARTQTELVAIQRWYDRMGYNAFIRGESVRVEWKSPQTIVAISDNELVGEKNTQFVTADYQGYVVFTPAGIPSRSQISLVDQSGRGFDLTLAGSLSLRSAY